MLDIFEVLGLFQCRFVRVIVEAKRPFALYEINFRLVVRYSKFIF